MLTNCPMRSPLPTTPSTTESPLFGMYSAMQVVPHGECMSAAEVSVLTGDALRLVCGLLVCAEPPAGRAPGVPKDPDPVAGSVAWVVAWVAGVGEAVGVVAVFADVGWLLGGASRVAASCEPAAGEAVCGERVSSRPAAAAATMTKAAGSAISTARRRWARTRPWPARPGAA